MRSLLYTVPLLLCYLLISVANAQRGVVYTPTISGATVQVWSNWFTVSLSQPATSSFTITLSTTTGQADFYPSTLNFDPTTQAATFRLKPSADGIVVVSYTLDATGLNEFFAPSNGLLFSSLRSASLDYFGNTLVIDYPTEPIKISLNYASSADLTFTPTSSDGTIEFMPTTITIPAGSLAASFRAIATQDIAPDFSVVTWTISGNEASWYSNISATNMNVLTRVVRVPLLSTVPLLGVNATESYVYTYDVPNSTFTVTPVAADTVFTPSVLEFSQSTRAVKFSYVTKSPTSKTVYYYINGDGDKDYGRIGTSSLTVAKRSFTVQAPSSYVINRKTKMSISLGAPSVNPINVALFAANLEFTPNNVTFDGSETTIDVDVMPVAMGPDTISFLTTGQDEEWFSHINDIPLTVFGGQFLGPSQWYIPLLFLGVESPDLPVRVSVPPTKSVTLTPVSSDMVFTPSSLTFTSTSQQQSFKMTPAFTNTAANSLGISNPRVEFIVGGEDMFSYAAPTPISVQVSRRDVQFRWSAHVTTAKQLHLGKKYIVWATLNYPPESQVTVTPVNPYLTFEPSVLEFSADNIHVKFTATVNAAVGTTVIDYIIGGDEGGLYQTPASDVITTNLRPLGTYQAVIAPDDRTSKDAAVLVNITLGSILTLNHIYSVSLASNVIPDGSITITPKSHHITFDPPSVDLSVDTLTNYRLTTTTSLSQNFDVNDYMIVANFTVTAKAPGRHLVWVELSGDDANYYDVPDNFYLFFNEELRVDNEKPAHDSGANLFASPSVLTLFVLLLIVSLW